MHTEAMLIEVMHIEEPLSCSWRARGTAILVAEPAPVFCKNGRRCDSMIHNTHTHSPCSEANLHSFFPWNFFNSFFLLRIPPGAIEMVCAAMASALLLVLRVASETPVASDVSADRTYCARRPADRARRQVFAVPCQCVDFWLHCRAHLPESAECHEHTEQSSGHPCPSLHCTAPARVRFRCHFTLHA